MTLLLRIVMWPFSQLLNLLFTLTGSYGMSIILFAVVIKLLMLYPSAKSKRNMMHMSRMTPKLQELQRRYGKNQERYAMEMQKLYKEEHVNPMGGCLWSLLPLPILMALYGIIRRPIINFMFINESRPKALENLELIREKLESVGYEITGQAAYEEIGIAKGVTEHLDEIREVVPNAFGVDFMFCGIDLTAIPMNAFMRLFTQGFTLAGVLLILIPVVSGLLNWVMMRVAQRGTVVTEGAMQSQQKMMQIMMPLMSVYIGFILPASLGLYWIAMSVFSIFQELFLQKYYNKKLDAEEAQRAEASRLDRMRRMEEAKSRPQVPSKEKQQQKKEKQKQQHAKQHAEKKKKASTTEAGRVGDRPYARGRAFGGHYDNED